MSEIPGRYADQFNLRLPDGMRDRLKAEAEANKRSMNAEIVARIQNSLDAQDAQLTAAEQHSSDQLFFAKKQHEITLLEYERAKASTARLEEMVASTQATLEAAMEIMEQVRAERRSGR